VGLDSENVVPGAGRRPHLVVLQQVRVDIHAQVRGMSERGHATYRVAGDLAHPVGVDPVALRSPRGVRQSLLVELVRTAHVRQHDFVGAIGMGDTEDQALDDLADIDPYRCCGISGGAGAVGESPGGDDQAESSGGSDHPAGIRVQRLVGHQRIFAQRLPWETGQMRAWRVAGAIVETADGVLMVCNQRRNGSLDWTTPGGVIEDGEHVLEGLAREVKEETGIVVTAWGEPVYEVIATAPDLGWEMQVEVHRAVAFEGSLVIDDPDGIVIEALHMQADACLARLAEAAPWVREPMSDYLQRDRGAVTATAATPPLYRYHIAGSDRSSWQITRL
jgi:8-oxo-dGTP diphosphatase